MHELDNSTLVTNNLKNLMTKEISLFEPSIKQSNKYCQWFTPDIKSKHNLQTLQKKTF